MTWSDFYLLCFLVGFSLSVLSFMAGAVHIHLPFKMHLPFHGAHHGGTGASTAESGVARTFPGSTLVGHGVSRVVRRNRAICCRGMRTSWP